MKVNSYFWLIVTVMLIMALATVRFGLESGSWLFYLTESFAAVVLVLLILLYRKVIRPIKIISRGMDLLVQQDFASRLVPVGQREADKIVAMFNEMMDRLKEQRLQVREQNRFLDLLVNASPMGIVTFDSSGRVASVNNAAVAMFEYDDMSGLIGKRLSEMDNPLAVKTSRLKRGDVITVRLSDSHIYKCSMLSYIDSGWAHLFLLIESLTDEVMAAEQRAYGKVIRMIAHEVNNTMCGVGSMLSAISMSLTGSMADALEACEERCRDLSGFISKFAEVVKLPEPELESVDLNVFVDSISVFLQSLCTPAGTHLSIKYSPAPVFVRIDVLQFQQVMVNIVKNAVESIMASGEVVIDIRNGKLPMMVITDNGAGIPDEVAYNLFSPFYSTKPNGNGIGLTLIAEVLKKHNCRFSLATSRTDGLTRFTINFPRTN